MVDPYPMQSRTLGWLYNYQNELLDEEELQADDNIITDLQRYVPSQPIRLYRGMHFSTPVSDRKIFTSWSKSLDVARIYASEEKYGIIISMIAQPKNILCDTTLIRQLPHEEEEVMIFYGSYVVKTVELTFNP